MTKQELEKANEKAAARDKAEKISTAEVKAVVTDLKRASRLLDIAATEFSNSKSVPPKLYDYLEQINYTTRQLLVAILFDESMAQKTGSDDVAPIPEEELNHD